MSELQSFARTLSKIRQEATVESLLSGPNTNAHLDRLVAELRQISDARASMDNSADQITEQAAAETKDS
jgi:hypothetical protein